jgi:hypothetical protein
MDVTMVVKDILVGLAVSAIGYKISVEITLNILQKEFFYKNI